MNNQRIYQLIIEDPKPIKSEQIATLPDAISEFLQNGGKVTQIDRGESVHYYPRNRAQRAAKK